MGQEARDSSKRQLDLGSKAFFWVLSIQGRENGILVAVGGNIPQNFDNSTEEAEATGFSNTMEVNKHKYLRSIFDYEFAILRCGT